MNKLQHLQYLNFRKPSRYADNITAIQAKPSLDLNFARNKSLMDNVTGNNLVTFTRASGGTYVDSAGVLQTASTDEPRFDHNPMTGESLGLLVEEQRTNIIVSSQSFNSGGWTLDGVSLTANAAAAPDGTTTATSIVQGTGNNRTYHFDNSGVTGSKVFSIFAKANAGTSLAITSTGGMSPNATATVNLSNGTVSGFTGATVQAYPNGWYRILLPVSVSSASGSGTYWTISGPASSVCIWGAQLEAGAFPTSYIPTTTAAATRNADVASITGTNFSSWYNQAEGTVFAETNILATATGTNRIIQLGGATTADRQDLFFTAGTLTAFVNVGGVAQVNATTSNSISANQNTRSGYAYKQDDFGWTLNSGAMQTDTSGSLPVVDRLGIGSRTDAAAYLNGHIRRLTYFPQRISNANLQRITQ